MMTSTNYEATIQSEKDPQLAFQKTADDRNGLPATEVRTLNVDPGWFTALALGARHNVTLILEQLTAVPEFDVMLPERLEECALAFSYAHTLHQAATRNPDDLTAMLQEARDLRDRFRFDNGALVARGIIPATALSKCTWQSGFVNVAEDLQLIATVYEQNWAGIVGKSGIDRSELDRARKLATGLLRNVGKRESAKASPDQTADARNRAFTLLVRCYDEIDRAVTYARWHQGDAEQFAPSLYKGRRRRSAAEDEAPAEPAAPVQPTENNTNPGGSPFIG